MVVARYFIASFENSIFGKTESWKTQRNEKVKKDQNAQHRIIQENNLIRI